MPNRIASCFQSLRSSGKSGFVAYVTAGDPSPESTVEIVAALERAGVDLVELGVPFSDPLADGSTIQAAAGRALAAGTSVAKVLEIIRQIRRASEIPIVLFTYLNPVYIYGYGAFIRDAAAAGADGLLILDLPPDEAEKNDELHNSDGLLPIRLIAPTTPPDRMEIIAKSAQGFIYYVSREGVTGEQTGLSETIASQVDEIRRHTDLPIAVGFGISTPDHAATVARHGDAVVVGSAIVRRIGEFGNNPGLAQMVYEFTAPLVQATKSAR